MVSFCIFSFLSQQHTIFHTVFSLPASAFAHFLSSSTFLYKMSTPSSRRLLPSVAPATAPVSRPQCPLPSFSSLAPALEPSDSTEGVSSPSVPPATRTLARQLCLRCAKLAARHPDASCEFDKSNSEKCRYCRDQKSPCNLVSNLRFFSYLTTNFEQIHSALVPRGRELLQYRRRLRVAGTEALRANLCAYIQTVARTFRSCAEGFGRGSNAPPTEADVVSGPVPPAAAIATRAIRPATTVSRALILRIVQAPWPPISEATATATTTSSWGSSGPPPSLPSPLAISPVALYEGDIIMSGTVASSVLLGLRSPSPAIIPPPFVSPRPLLPRVLSTAPAAPAAPAVSVAPSAPAAPAAPAQIAVPTVPAAPSAPAAPTQIAPTAAQWEQLMSLLRDQHAEQLAELRGIAASLRTSVSFPLVLSFNSG